MNKITIEGSTGTPIPGSLWFAIDRTDGSAIYYILNENMQLNKSTLFTANNLANGVNWVEPATNTADAVRGLTFIANDVVISVKA